MKETYTNSLISTLKVSNMVKEYVLQELKIDKSFVIKVSKESIKNKNVLEVTPNRVSREKKERSKTKKYFGMIFVVEKKIQS